MKALKNNLKNITMIPFILIAFVLICISVDAIVQYAKKRSLKERALPTKTIHAFNEGSVSIPEGIYFDKAHTWAFMEQNGDVKIGIDDFLLHITGPISRVKMKAQGEKIHKGEYALSIIQNGKQLNIKAPVSGTVKSQNPKLIEDYSLINTSPFQDGWVYTIEPSSWVRDINFLMMSKKYKNFINEEFTRLKDFLAFIMQKNETEAIPLTLQDGGELKDNLLSDFGPEEWEDFQTKFINAPK